jgi:hypothetical protein
LVDVDIERCAANDIDDFKPENYGITSYPQVEVEHSGGDVVECDEDRGYWHMTYQDQKRSGGQTAHEVSKPINYRNEHEGKKLFMTGTADRVSSADQLLPDTGSVPPRSFRHTTHPPLYPSCKQRREMKIAYGFVKKDADELRREALEMSYSARIHSNYLNSRADKMSKSTSDDDLVDQDEYETLA